MISPKRNEFLTVRAWHKAVTINDEVILRRTSALEYLQLFNGYLNEINVDVYATQLGRYDNVNYFLVDTFDGIDYINYGDVLCASANQTFNEMLEDYDNIDVLALIEGLAEYYHTHDKSFDGLSIHPNNIVRFDLLKDWAYDYYRRY